MAANSAAPKPTLPNDTAPLDIAGRSAPLAALTALLLFAGPPAEAKKKTFEATTDVVEVQVPVNVVGRDGEPIRGLTADDFEVIDSGKRQTLTGFDVIDLSADEAEVEAQLERLPAVARRNFLLLFDFSFSSPNSILRARKAAHEFVLRSLHESDLAAIATFSLEYGPKLVITFTPDRAQLAQAIDTLGLLRRPGISGDPLRFLVSPPGISDPGTGSGETSERPELKEAMESAGFENQRVIGNQMRRNERAFERSRITAWSRSMGDLGRALNGVAGRKHVIYFSEGFDSELLLGRRPTVTGRELELQDRLEGRLWMVDGDETYGNVPLQNAIGDMLEEFRRADAVIQAVDASGLRLDFDESAPGGSGSDGLFFIANETGGELFEDANNLADQLDRVVDRSEVTYILSFQPKGLKNDGKYHRLKVKLKDHKGVRIAHRDGYYAPRPFQELHPLEKNLLASDAIASASARDDVGLDVLAAPFRSSADSAYIPVIIEMQGSSLLVGQNEDQLNVEIYTYVTDDEGEMRDFFTQVVGFDLERNRDRILEAGVKYYGHLELAPGDYLLRVLVRNASTGRSGVETVRLEIPTYDSAELRVLPPFFHDRPERWVLLRERQREGQSKTVVYPFTVEGEPFVPAARPRLRSGQTADFCLVAYNLDSEPPNLQSWIVAADGAEVPSDGVLRVERTVTGISGLDKLKASFRPRDLEAGEYTLKVALTDPATGIAHSNSIPFVIAN